MALKDMSGPTGETEPDMVVSPMSRALWWHPDDLPAIPGPTLPFLPWLIEVARPRLIVTLTGAEGHAHVLASRAVGLFAPDAPCVAVMPMNVPASGIAGLRERVSRGDPVASRILQLPDQAAVRALGSSAIDLLVIDRPVDEDLMRAIEAHWLPCLSDRAVTAYVRGGNSAALADRLRRAEEEGCLFTLDPEADAALTLDGAHCADGLARLGGLPPSGQRALAVRRVFSRLAELHRAEAELRRLRAKEDGAAEAERDALRARVDSLMAHLAESDGMIAEARSAAFDSQAALESERARSAQLDDRQRDIAVLGNTIAALETKLEAKSARIQAGRRDVAALRDRIAALEAESAQLARHKEEAEIERARVDALLASTSWRASAPLRALGRLLGRG